MAGTRGLPQPKRTTGAPNRSAVSHGKAVASRVSRLVRERAERVCRPARTLRWELLGDLRSCARLAERLAIEAIPPEALSAVEELIDEAEAARSETPRSDEDVFD